MLIEGGSTSLIAFVIAVALAIFVSEKFKINIGLTGIFFAFVLGSCFGGMTPAGIIGMMPSSLFGLLLCITAFFGFINSTGCFDGVVGRIIWLGRGKPWLIPILCYVAGWLVVAAGAGAFAGPLIVCPVAMLICRKANINPLMGVMMSYCGSEGGCHFMWGESGAGTIGLLSGVLTPEEAASTIGPAVVSSNVTYLIAFFICYVVFKAYKIDKDSELIRTLEKPEPFTAIQKRGLITALVVIALIAVPTMLRKFVPGVPAFAWFAGHVEVRFLTLAGALFCAITKTYGTTMEDVFKTFIPWRAIVAICGMGCLVGVAGEIGVIDYLSGILTSGNISPTWVMPAVVLIGGFLGIISNGLAVAIPLLVPLIPSLSEVTGMTYTAVGQIICTGVIVASVAPISTGGMMNSIGMTDEEHTRYFWPQMLIAIGLVVIYAILTLVGFNTWLDRIFVG
ncbi:MAG: hypothetical protein IJP92_01120 [Lachnospiraceae bacterium]|nr:hypothetical protein [Lachnospiraceae bacterium]